MACFTLVLLQHLVTSVLVCLGSRVLLVTIFISMSIYLCPYWFLGMYIDIIDHYMKEPPTSQITQKEL